MAEPGVATEEPLPPMVVSRLKQFTSMVKVKRVAMKVREDERGGWGIEGGRD